MLYKPTQPDPLVTCPTATATGPEPTVRNGVYQRRELLDRVPNRRSTQRGDKKREKSGGFGVVFVVFGAWCLGRAFGAGGRGGRNHRLGELGVFSLEGKAKLFRVPRDHGEKHGETRLVKSKIMESTWSRFALF